MKYSEDIDNAPGTLPELFKNIEKYPSIGRMIAQHGRKLTLAVIVKGIYGIIEGMPHELTETAIKRLAEYLEDNHRNLTPAEFKVIGNRLLRKQIYGKVNINTIAREIDLYWEERLNYAEEEAIKKASQFKKEEISSEDLKRMYAEIKNEVPKTRGDKLRARYDHQVKIILNGQPEEMSSAKAYTYAQRLYIMHPEADPEIIIAGERKKLKEVIPPEKLSK